MNDLFGQPLNTGGRQPELFPDNGGHLDTDAECPQCGKPMVTTPSGFVTCFWGCVGLREQANADGDSQVPAGQQP